MLIFVLRYRAMAHNHMMLLHPLSSRDFHKSPLYCSWVSNNGVHVALEQQQNVNLFPSVT